MRNLFVLTTSVYSDVSSFSYEERLDQILVSVSSIRAKDPSSVVVLADNSVGVNDSVFVDFIKKHVDVIICLRDVYGVSVLKKYDPIPGIPTKKGPLETHSIIESLKIVASKIDLSEINRVFKMNGRYQLMDSFDVAFYNSPEFVGKYVFKKRVPTWKSNEKEFLFMVDLDLWSFPVSLLGRTVEILYKVFYDSFFLNSVFSNVDVEHIYPKEFENECVAEISMLHIGRYRDFDRKFEVR